MKKVYRFLIYELFRIYFYLTLRIFFRTNHFQQDHKIKGGVPTIVVSNHPNTLIDPILCGLLYKGQLNFLANTGLFQNAIARWFFLLHFCIPIQRSQDPDMPGFPLERSFDLCLKALKNNRTVYIAPEGTSLRGYGVRKIKYGTEKIIKDFIQENDRPIQLVVDAFNYQAPGDFRSFLSWNTVFVEQISDANESGHITGKIEKSLKDNVIDIPDMSMEEGGRIGDVLFPDFENADKWKEKLLALGRWIRNAANNDVLKGFNEFIQEHSIKPGAGAEDGLVLRWKIFLVFLAPVFVICFLAGFLPRMFGSMVLKTINTDKEYDSTIKVTVYPLLFLLYSLVIAALLFSNVWLFIPFLTALALLEVFRKSYVLKWQRFQSHRSFERKSESVKTDFHKLRKQILGSLGHDH